jgi:hypothetical protein
MLPKKLLPMRRETGDASEIYTPPPKYALLLETVHNVKVTVDEERIERPPPLS